MSELLYKCDNCGEPTDDIYRDSDILPKSYTDKYGDSEHHWYDKCREKAAEFSEWQNEQFRESNIICPWCGYEDEESYEQEDSDDEYECPCCGKVFELEVETETHYTTRKPADMYEQEDNE